MKSKKMIAELARRVEKLERQVSMIRVQRDASPVDEIDGRDELSATETLGALKAGVESAQSVCASRCGGKTQILIETNARLVPPWEEHTPGVWEIEL